jgi:hypothetical protein
VFARIARHAGYYMGARVNRTEDALEFYKFANHWIPRYWRAWARGEPLPDSELMRLEFAECIREHRAPMRDPRQPWGWKQPRSMHFLPFVREVYPGMRLIHVVRDGRDVAFGRPGHLRARGTGEITLGPNVRGEAEQVRMARFWSEVNALAADYGEAEMGEHYLRIRFEDVCDRPAPTLARILRFASVAGEPKPTPEMLSEIVRPDSIGRWREQDPQIVAAVTEVAADGLRRFGYTSSS